MAFCSPRDDDIGAAVAGAARLYRPGVAREGPTIVGHYTTLPVRVSIKGIEVEGAWGSDAMVAPERQRRGLGEELFRTWDRSVDASLGLGLSDASSRLLKKIRFPDVAPVPGLVKPLTRRAVRLPQLPMPLNKLISLVSLPIVRVAARVRPFPAGHPGHGGFERQQPVLVEVPEREEQQRACERDRVELVQGQPLGRWVEQVGQCEAERAARPDGRLRMEADLREDLRPELGLVAVDHDEPDDDDPPDVVGRPVLASAITVLFASERISRSTPLTATKSPNDFPRPRAPIATAPGSGFAADFEARFRAGAACSCADSVALNSSASGPSRMLARFRAIEDLLRQVAVGVRGGAAVTTTRWPRAL